MNFLQNGDNWIASIATDSKRDMIISLYYIIYYCIELFIISLLCHSRIIIKKGKIILIDCGFQKLSSVVS